MENRPLIVSITTGTLLKTALIIVGAWLLFQLRDLALILIAAVVIASAIEPAIDALQRRKVPRVLAVLLLYLLLIAAFFSIFYFFIPSLFGDLSALIATFPSYIETINRWGAFEEYAGLFGTSGVPEISTASLTESARGFLGTLGVFGSNAFSAIANIFGGVFSFLLILIFSFYFAVLRTGVDDFLAVITPRRYQAYILDLWKRSRQKIGLWMQGQLLLAVIIGVLVYLGLTILGVKHALLLAVIAAMFELIPVFGPILAAVPAVLLALIDGGVNLALFTVALYVIVQQFESHLIHPLVVTRVVGVPPLLVILALIIGAQMAGFLGILLSVPVAAVIQELVKDIREQRFLAENGS